MYFDGLASDLAHGEGGATAGVTIEFGQNDAGNPDGVVEVLRNRNGLLTGGGVGDEEGFFGLNELMELLKLFDEEVVDFLATGGVENDDGGLARFLGFESLFGNFDEVFFTGLGGKDGNFALCTQHLQLLDGGGTVKVASDEEGLAAVFLEAAGELGGGGGLTGTVQSTKENVSGRIEVERALITTEKDGELVVEDFDNLARQA